MEPLRLADAPDVLSAAEVAAVLRIDKDKVYELLHRQIIKNRRSGKRFIIPKRSVERYLAMEDQAS